MKPNKQTYIDFIISQLNKGNYNTNIPKNGYYVYIIFNEATRQPIYIGKGKNKRVLFHFNNSKNYLNKKIKYLKHLGNEIKYSIVEVFENENESYKFERYLIESALKNKIDLLNIALTHKSLFVRIDFKELVLLIESMANSGYCFQKSKKILSKQKALNILIEILREQSEIYPDLAKRYKLFNINCNDVLSIKLGKTTNTINIKK